MTNINDTKEGITASIESNHVTFTIVTILMSSNTDSGNT